MDATRVTDRRAQRAATLHNVARSSIEAAAGYRAERDKLIRELRAEDPRVWTYAELARVVGCSPELIAVIIRGLQMSEADTVSQ